MQKHFFVIVTASLALVMLASCGRTAYDNPIATNSQQPDKILFDKAINDLEKHRYELTRLTLHTLINTYPDSEYIAKAKLAIADSWYREGTSHALAQAEAEYEDFQTFFPTMEEAAESQMKICRIHYDQMHSADRDQTHVRRADQECRQMLMQNPNSRHAEATRQLLREVQELLADGEFRVGAFYSFKGSYRAASNRLQAVTDHYPLFSRSDEALWILADTYSKMGDEYAEQRADALHKRGGRATMRPRSPPFILSSLETPRGSWRSSIGDDLAGRPQLSAPPVVVDGLGRHRSRQRTCSWGSRSTPIPDLECILGCHWLRNETASR